MSDEYFGENKHRHMHHKDGLFSEYIFSLIKDTVLKDCQKFHAAFELGAGVGRFSYALTKEYQDVYLIEPSQDCANQLRSVFRDPHVHIMQMTAAEYFHAGNIPENSICYGFHVLHHMSVSQRKELFHCIKKLCLKAVFLEPNPWNPMILLQIISHPDMQFKMEKEYLKLTKNRLQEELRSCDLNASQHMPVCFFVPAVANILLRRIPWKVLSLFEKANPFFPFMSAYQLICFGGS